MATVSEELAAILQMRLGPEYQAAEAIRQSLGAAAMAMSSPSTPPYAGIRLMVGTWDAIALRVQGNDPLKVPFYQNNPVGFMWLQLQPGIKVIRGEFKGRAQRFYAMQFEHLNRAYMRWLKKQPAAYRTAALQGINAQFG
jgi:hypothetical protein